MPELPFHLGGFEPIVTLPAEDDPLIHVKCALCHKWGHRLEWDGTLVCIHCEIPIAAHETLERPSILRVNLPRTWQVSALT